MQENALRNCGPTLATGLAGKHWCIRVASIATTAVPSNNAAALPATISATARGASTSQPIANECGFSAMLAQTNATPPKLPTKTDPLPKQQTATNNGSGTPRITDPNPVSSAIASTAADSHPTKSTPTGSKKASASSDAQSTVAQQKQGAPTSPFIGGLQTGPAISQTKNPIPGQTGDSDMPPNIVLQDAGASQNAVDAQGAQTANVSQASSDDQEPQAPAILQADLLDTLSSRVTASVPAAKDAATPQPTGKTSNATQLSALMQSLQPAAHRTAATQAPQAPDSQTPDSQTNANAQTPAPNAQSQSGDGGNSSVGHNHSEQARGSSDSAPSPSPDAANTAAAQSPSAAANTTNALTSTAVSAGGVSAAVTTQNSGAATGSVSLHVAPTVQTNAQTAQPDLNALAINIAAKSQGGAKQFDIRLEPAELGRVEVRLTVDNAGNAQAHLVAERPETLQMLQRDSATLSHALKDTGVQLGDNGLQFSLKGQERQGDGGQQGTSRAKPLSVSAVRSTENISPVSSPYGLPLSRVGIDIRV